MTGKLKEFSLVDPFNVQNTVSGVINIAQNDDYGALTIYEVNGERFRRQKISGTPKMHYPEYVSTYGKSNKFFHSKEHEIYDVQAYEKIDGSNIFGFVYYDSEGNPFVSYKLRLRPFVANSRFGNFFDLFNSVKPLGLDEYILNSGYNLSMELWGQYNPHLIHYPAINLQLTVLFGRQRSYNNYIIPPDNLPENDFNKPQYYPMCFSGLRYGYDDLKTRYELFQDNIEEELQPYSDGTTDENVQFIGKEGLIWYVRECKGDKVLGNWTPYKLKPHSIEEIHWGAGADKGINTEVLRSASLKAIEAYDEPTVEDLVSILSEDWGEVAIGLAMPNIEGVLQSVKDELLFNIKVWEIYFDNVASLGIEGKNNVMRALSPHFEKREIGSVYSVIKAIFNED